MATTPPTKYQITDLTPYLDSIQAIIEIVRTAEPYDPEVLKRAMRRHTKPNGDLLSKNLLVRGYRQLCDQGAMTFDRTLLKRIQMKPVRTSSGVAPVTVLTMPYPCPGKCIFCPTDYRMPKSYLRDEPGAMRAEMHQFDPYEQTANRIHTFYQNGHNVDKIELLILGGTWSSYRADYQQWFIQRCLDAMNQRDSQTLAEAQQWNQTAPHRNVGLVIETRPDHITPAEVQRLRHLGVTKVQMGAQSLNDHVLAANQRGHTADHTRQAMALLRAAGFKIVLHWMPNLLAATPESDYADYQLLWDDPALRPDELKIYPCSLLQNADLYDYWQRGEFHPYDDQTLVDLVARCKVLTPAYCRINRVYRDIPAPNIVAGSKLSNLRQVVRTEMKRRGTTCGCIRCREVRREQIDGDTLRLHVHQYNTTGSHEHFIAFNTPTGKLAGFCRLSLPTADAPPTGITEIDRAALIREIHVYGPALKIGGTQDGHAQHLGLGTRLLQHAEQLARQAGYPRIAVIAAIGTRQYYHERGYQLGETYMLKALD